MDQQGPPVADELSRLGGLFDFHGRTALVTGAGSGLGRAITLGLAYYGADVVAADLDLGGAEAAAAASRELGRRATAIRADVADWDSVRAMVADAEAFSSHIDIAFNVPGINVRKPALELSPEEFRRVLDVNLFGVFHCAKAIGELMVRHGGGRMVNVASIYGHVALEGQAAYAASKHAVIGLTKVLALEWASHNVRVNALAPGYVHTNLTAPLVADRPRYERLAATTPLGRFAEPVEIVGRALFLVSDDYSYGTGTSLLVDGG